MQTTYTKPKPNIHLTSSLTQPNGRPLINAPSIGFDELLDSKQPSASGVLGQGKISAEPKRLPLRVPFLYDKLPQLDLPPKNPKGESLYPPTSLENDVIFERRLHAEKEPEDDWKNIPELPKWDLPKQMENGKRSAEIESKAEKEELPVENEEHRCCFNTEDKNPLVVIPDYQSVVSTEEHSPPSTPHIPLLQAEGLTKSYYKRKLRIPVLKGVNFSVQKGEFISIVGQSGSGKSTLLHLLGTLDNPEYGEIHFEGQRIDNLPLAKRDKLRNHDIGFIFQFYHLLPELTTLENVLSPQMIRNGFFAYFRNRKHYVERAKNLLEKVGLSHRLKHKPCELSGGEMQRAAIARALIAEPKILMADEPTGNLDSVSAKEIITLLQKLKAEQNLTIIMVTHDNTIAQVADHIVRIADGIIVNG